MCPSSSTTTKTSRREVRSSLFVKRRKRWSSGKTAVKKLVCRPSLRADSLCHSVTDPSTLLSSHAWPQSQYRNYHHLDSGLAGISPMESKSPCAAVGAARLGPCKIRLPSHLNFNPEGIVSGWEAQFYSGSPLLHDVEHKKFVGTLRSLHEVRAIECHNLW